MKKRFLDYVMEIEDLKENFKLNAFQVFLLHVASAFEVDNLNYEKLKEEFIKSKL